MPSASRGHGFDGVITVLSDIPSPFLLPCPSCRLHHLISLPRCSFLYSTSFFQPPINESERSQVEYSLLGQQVDSRAVVFELRSCLLSKALCLRIDRTDPVEYQHNSRPSIGLRMTRCCSREQHQDQHRRFQVGTPMFRQTRGFVGRSFVRTDKGTCGG